MGRNTATRLTAATPDQLAAYRTEHYIQPVREGDRHVCGVDGIVLIRRGFSGYLHDPTTIRRLARIERGEPEYV